MEQKDIQQYSDAEFKAAMIATMNLKQEWIASVDFHSLTDNLLK